MSSTSFVDNVGSAVDLYEIALEDTGSYFVFSDATFVGNHSAQQGGAMYLDFPSVTITDSQFEDNDAELGGGAIWALPPGPYTTGDLRFELDISSSGFSSNRVPTSAPSEGGGVLHVETSPVTHDSLLATVRLQDVLLDSNSARTGGGLQAVLRGPATVTLQDVQLVGNAAVSSGSAIDVYAAAPLDLTLEDVVATANDSDRGSAIGLVSSDALELSLLRGQITSNTVSGSCSTGAVDVHFQGGSLTLSSDATDWGTGTTDNDCADLDLHDSVGDGDLLTADLGASENFAITCDDTDGCVQTGP